MNTGSLFFALAEELYACIRSERRQEWELLRSKDCNDSFTADACSNFFPRTCSAELRKHDKREPEMLKRRFSCTEMLCLCGKTYCGYDSLNNKFKLKRGLIKRTIEDSGDVPMARNRKVLDETKNVTCTNRGFRTNKPCVATYEQSKKVLLYFYP